ncbi:lysylphosphatidylglycerol synthase domain-containing protein [Streptomyces coacervatus]|uniref:Lysylphosphatidylglycerol synthase domain-containing protein n=1 Tax=Streptomyces coacervatus TaxID=647381 RepID=A0ABP7JQ70_9ACTN|nr:lysylphosphatidylglycerol synthase domain-containing protein [Streptomyces coacervatus]MDF2263923.1 lysylphosphatidylglycerol synthase domain-containing protein [Streptomyces coacervatus]
MSAQVTTSVAVGSPSGLGEAPQRGAGLYRSAAPPRGATSHNDAADEKRPIAAHPAERLAPWQTVAALVVAAGAVGLAARHWAVLDSAADRLAVADRGWLLLAALLTLLTWGCAALAQQGAVREVLPAGRLVTVQFAASAANHLLPAGLGAGAVNLRFLMRCGLAPGRAATALAVKSTAGALARLALIAVLALACPGVLQLPSVGGPKLLVGALVAVAVLPVAVLLVRRKGLRRVLACAAADVRAVHENPRRAAALWGGSLAFAALHTGVVIAVVHALDVPLPAGRVALAYLAASSAAVLLPTPGGLGSLDAALAWALTTAGAPGSASVSAVLGYRLLTVWLPLVPGLAVLAGLVRTRAL